MPNGAGGEAGSSAGLAVHGVPAVPGAELLQLDAVRVVTPVLPGDVVPVLALRTRQSDLRTDVGRLGHGGVPSCSVLKNTTLQRNGWGRGHAKRCSSGGRT